MQNTKNIKIISALYEKILAEGDFEETVEKLLVQYSATMVAIQQNEIGDFFLNVAGRNIPYKITGTKKTVRISIILYDSLRRSRILPEESFSSVLFRLFAVQQREQGQSGILIKIGDCRQILKTIPSNSVHCCVTSPPYYGLRSYCDSDSPEKYLEIGIEPTPQDYIYNLVEVFREVRRVLREDSSLWLVLGDCYSSYKDAKGVTQTLSKGTSRERAHIIPKGEARNRDGKMLKANGYKNKYLMGLPWAVVNALREDDWWLRSDIIYNKSSCLPESTKDRPVRAHEYVFLLSKSERYFYDNKAVENQRNVWIISPEPSNGHIATFPLQLVESCVKAGTSEKGCCPECGSPWKRVMEDNRTVRWEQSCKCTDREPVPCVVLDPFAGSGTVGEWCLNNNRRAILIELNPNTDR